jgi:hypothetical protein
MRAHRRKQVLANAAAVNPRLLALLPPSLVPALREAHYMHPGLLGLADARLVGDAAWLVSLRDTAAVPGSSALGPTAAAAAGGARATVGGACGGTGPVPVAAVAPAWAEVAVGALRRSLAETGGGGGAAGLPFATLSHAAEVVRRAAATRGTAVGAARFAFAYMQSERPQSLRRAWPVLAGGVIWPL